MSGETCSGFQTNRNPPDFKKLREQHFEDNNLFEDPEFQPAFKYYKLARPKEIVDDPQFCVKCFSRFSPKQGALNDCWLFAAMVNLTSNISLSKKVMPVDQGFDKEKKYAGIFHFNFWQYNRWQEVIIDDKLPVEEDKDSGKLELVYGQSFIKNEFWPALLEKAYAKLHGSYDLLEAGLPGEAMIHFTGGVLEVYDLKRNEVDPDLFNIILRRYESHSLMGCFIEDYESKSKMNPKENTESDFDDVLDKNHSYSITKVQSNGSRKFLRLRNPVGVKPFYVRSKWFISDIEKNEIGSYCDKSEFWIQFKDFHSNFHRLEVCNLSLNTLCEDDSTNDCNEKWGPPFMIEGKWERDTTAGGQRMLGDSHWSNPKYIITLKEKNTKVIVALMQKYQRRNGKKLLSIGLEIYRVSNLPNPEKGVTKLVYGDFFKSPLLDIRTTDSTFRNSREVINKLFGLNPGVYCVVPCTENFNEEGEFLLRLFFDHQIDVMEYGEDKGLSAMECNKGSEPIAKETKAESQLSQEEKKNDLVMATFNKPAHKEGEVGFEESSKPAA